MSTPPGDVVPGAAETAATLEVLATGPLTTVQDLGRPGHRATGVGSSGAADRPALRLAHRLVGDPEDAAGLEVTLGGLVFVPDADVVVAVTGAPAPVTVDGVAAPAGAPVRVRAGAEVRLGTPALGLRTYLAVRGGIDVAPVLGSRSTDVLSGLGPPRVETGQRLPVGVHRAAPAHEVDLAPLPAIAHPHEVVTLRASPGPQWAWFPEAGPTLTGATYEVSPDSDRSGVRLRGPALASAHRDAPGSAGLLPGAVQVPTDAQPIVFLADAPATGGYPVVAVLVEADLAAAAQLRPGHPVTFRIG